MWPYDNRSSHLLGMRLTERPLRQLVSSPRWPPDMDLVVALPRMIRLPVGANRAWLQAYLRGRFVAIDAESLEACAIDLDGQLSCWGAYTDLGIVPPAGTYTQVSVGGERSCALADGGEITCWGMHSLGPRIPPTGVFTEVSTSLSHSCALDEAANATCWLHTAAEDELPPPPEPVDVGGVSETGEQMGGAATGGGLGDAGTAGVPMAGVSGDAADMDGERVARRTAKIPPVPGTPGE